MDNIIQAINLNYVFAILISVVLAYLFGSINFAIVISKIFYRDDIRKHGSNNAGMTNMLRTYGKLPGLFTLLGDISKGIIAILLAKLIFYLFSLEISIIIELIAACFALLGHIYPIFFKFKGGKGVLVSVGAVILLIPIPIIMALIVFGIILLTVKIMSLASIAGCVTAFATTWILGIVYNDPDVLIKTIIVGLITGFIIFMHRQNIVRLFKKTEPKLSFKKKEKI